MYLHLFAEAGAILVPQDADFTTTITSPTEEYAAAGIDIPYQGSSVAGLVLPNNVCWGLP